MMNHDQPSPATSNATNRTNRGGRPREWTPPRARRLTRLYCYTSLKVDEILKVLGDEVWSPGKEAANKHLNHLLGKDPRWMRPRDLGEARQRIAGLKNSDRARSSSQSSSNTQNPLSPMSGIYDPSVHPYQRTDTMDSKSFGRSSGSSLEKTDTFMFGQPGLQQRTATTTFSIPPSARQNTGTRNLQTMQNPSYASFFRSIPGLGRQGTSMTTSTNFSIGSTKAAWNNMKEKLNGIEGLQKSDVKDVFRLLKRYTISNEDGTDHSRSSPRSAMGAFNPPTMANFRGQTEGVTSVADYSLPGDFAGTSESIYDSTTCMDQFGNTTYHLVAARENMMTHLFHLLSQENSPPSPLLNATNSGGQTFLHVLHPNWFEEDSRLVILIETLRSLQFDFSTTDVYGRTFFHILRSNLKSNSGLMREITSLFGNNMNLLNRRDAFGVKPMILRASTIPVNRAEARPSHLTIPGTTDSTQQKIKEHTKFLKIITDVNATDDGYTREDPQGRNALHCLAEVILDIASIDGQGNNTKPRKRKMDDQNEPVLQTCPLSHRIQYLDTVLQAHVDVNHYNASGDTVLMSFVSHITDGQDDKALEELIERLLNAGANIEARNRNGETVLQVAARLGQKFAVKVLLKQGANVHVRNSDGRSVLQTIDDYTRFSGDDDEALARLEATRGVLSGRFSNYKAVQEPSLLDQWSFRPPQLPNRFG
ncbi:hypothetical protein PFICI_09247 [Pestalotiopsis fici W106-1]|uniref:Uncharacterized protein n=1 Tax=Pestalotiopsis fici (strain W106-1 / CGMCC3.15140) TaxID=1229662 RepID=W3X045_PESFW|nr:uncharacterized protein PFICI_09247 [Pestalotiopsis fici W106-1]ETS79394.1 hypothetical protein PFICI_09247 [Pestalotiopsis fici W106-1]